MVQPKNSLALKLPFPQKMNLLAEEVRRGLRMVGTLRQ